MGERCHILDSLEMDHSDEACSILCKETAPHGCWRSTERPFACIMVRGKSAALLGLATFAVVLLFGSLRNTTEQHAEIVGVETWSHGSIVSLLASNSSTDDEKEEEAEDSELQDEAPGPEDSEDPEEQAKLSMQQEMEAAAQDAQQEAAQEEQALESGDDAKSEHMEGHKPLIPHMRIAAKPHLPFNCSAGFKHWERGWCYSKREWCCGQNKRGCETFHCTLDSDGSDANWSTAEKNWCCHYKNMGCKTAGYTKVAIAKNNFNAVDDEVHDKVSLKRGELVWAYSKTNSGWSYVLSRARKHPGWVPGSYLGTSKAVICVKDHLTPTGDTFQPQFSIHAGDTLWVIKQHQDTHSRWTYAYTQGLEGWVPGSILSFNNKPDVADIRAACTVQDFQASGEGNDEVSVKAGQVVWAADNNGSSNWTWIIIINSKKKGKVPAKVLKATTAVVVQKDFPSDHSSDPRPQLQVMRGDTVWVTHVRKSDWIYAHSRGREGWLPAWTVRQPDFGGRPIQAARHSRSGSSYRALQCGAALMAFLSLLGVIGVH